MSLDLRFEDEVLYTQGEVLTVTATALGEHRRVSGCIGTERIIDEMSDRRVEEVMDDLVELLALQVSMEVAA